MPVDPQIQALLDQGTGVPATHTLPVRGRVYAEKLKAAGVTVAALRYDGVNHGFMFWVGVVDKANAAMNEACEWLRSVFGERGGA
jgi:acetyl esterase/lipase